MILNSCDLQRTRMVLLHGLQNLPTQSCSFESKAFHIRLYFILSGWTFTKQTFLTHSLSTLAKEIYSKNYIRKILLLTEYNNSDLWLPCVSDGCYRSLIRLTLIFFCRRLRTVRLVCGRFISVLICAELLFIYIYFLSKLDAQFYVSDR